MFNSSTDLNVSVSDDHIGLEDAEDYYDDTSDNISDSNVNSTLDYCEEHIKIIRPYDPYTATVCALYFVFGVVCAFFGYRCFKAIMFLYGFIFGSIVVYLICVEEKVNYDNLS